MQKTVGVVALDELGGSRMRIHSNSQLPAIVFPALALTLLVVWPATVSAQDEPFQVLLVHSFRANLPVNTDWYNGIMRGFSSAPDLRFEIDIEAPDLSSFSDPDHVGDLLGIYRRKYRDQQPHLIISTFTPALRFLVEHGEVLFPGVPVVFVGADRRFVADLNQPSITGVTLLPDFTGTLELALNVHPDTKRVAVIVGSGLIDQLYELDARQALAGFEDKVKLQWLKGLPLAELVEEVRQLPPHSVILYVAQFQDRNGKSYIPMSTVTALSTLGAAPIYGLWDTLIGHGLIGGRLVTMEMDGYQAAQMGLRILRGERPADVPIIDRQQNPAIFDSRELARWGIDEDSLPAGSRIHNRQRTVWEDHKGTVLIAGSVMVLQGLLVLALWLNGVRLQRARTELQEEHNRRREAEEVTLGLRARLSRFSKERTLGAMATGIAHEVNQPLIAIQNYAQAAKRRAHSLGGQTSKLNELLEKIEQQSARAGGIIKRIRILVGTSEAELYPVLLSSVAKQVIDLMGPDLESRRCSVDFRPIADLPPVLADTLQIQLVLVNLLQNAVHNVAALEEETDRVLHLEIRQIDDREQQVSVANRGPGIPPDKIERVFEPFESNSQEGMGMGLAICQSIIDLHGGRIWCTANLGGGAMFHFTLRLAAP